MGRAFLFLNAIAIGKNYSGKFVVRVGKELHKSLTIEALKKGESLNTYCVRRLKQGTRRSSVRNRRKSSPCRASSR